MDIVNSDFALRKRPFLHQAWMNRFFSLPLVEPGII